MDKLKGNSNFSYQELENSSLSVYMHSGEPGAYNSSNGTEYSDDGSSMATMYGIRFIPYTCFALACILFNILSIGAMLNIRGHRTVHHVLLLNLAVCDMVGAVLLWMYYNSPLIFPHFQITTVAHCLFITTVIVAPYILSLCNSFLSLLILAINQYLAICNPFWSATKVTKRKACICIICVWSISIFLAITPAFLMLAMTRIQHCAMFATDMGVRSLEICAYALAGLIIIIVALYARVYRKILVYRRDQSQIRRNRNGQDSEGNYKAFITTAILTGTLVLFWLPYMVFHFISAHLDIEIIPDMVLNIKFYVIDFLPVLNFLTDPIVYGIRMKDIRGGYHRMFSRIFPCSSCMDTSVQGKNGSVRSTVRFTTLDTSI